MIHVVLCDDHAILRRGIRDTLADAPDIEVTGEAGGYSELREVLRTVACDILLLDLNMPGRSGLEVLTSLRETHSTIKVLVVSMYPEDQYALRCLKAGAQGYAARVVSDVAGDGILSHCPEKHGACGIIQQHIRHGAFSKQGQIYGNTHKDGI